MKRNYCITTTLLQNAIFDTIRFFEEYSLDDKVYENNTYRIKVAKKNICYFYQILKTDSGSRLLMKVQNPKVGMTQFEAVYLENIFINNLDKIINKEIIVTEGIAKKDVYRSAGSRGLRIIKLLLLFIAGFGLFVILKGCTS
jgi:hypothetical protein